MKSTAWMDDALCTNADPELFFPEQGRPRADGRKAMAICGDCPVRSECLDYATELDRDVFTVFGIWGGLPQNKRHRRSKR